MTVEHPNTQRRLADALRLALASTSSAEWEIRPWSWGPDAKRPGVRSVSVYRTQVGRTVPNSADQLPDGARGHMLTVDVMTAHEDMERAEDDLHEGTDEVLQVIDHDPGLDGYTWTSADRSVIGAEDAQIHAMRIDVWCLTTEEREQE